MLTVALISYHGPPANTSAAYRIGYFARYLPEQKFSILGVSKGDHPYDARLWQETPENTIKQASGSVSSIPYRVFCRVLKRYSDRYAWKGPALSLLEQTLSKLPDVILTSSPPLVSHAVGLAIKKKYNLPWIADFQDPLAGNPFSGKGLNEGINQWWQNRIFRHANYLIANTDATYRLWQSAHPKAAHKMAYLWNGYDPEEKFPLAPSPERSRTIRLVHVGDIYGHRHPLRLLECLVRLEKAGRLAKGEVAVSLVGPVEDQTGFLQAEAATALQATGQLIHDGKLLPKEEALAAMCQADALLLLDLNHKNTHLQVPAKLYDYLRAERPILAFTGRGSPTERILTLADVGATCIYDDDPEELVEEKVLSLARTFPRGQIAPSVAFRKEFDARALTRKLGDLIRDLAGDRPAQSRMSVDESVSGAG